MQDEDLLRKRHADAMETMRLFKGKDPERFARAEADRKAAWAELLQFWKERRRLEKESRQAHARATWAAWDAKHEARRAEYATFFAQAKQANGGDLEQALRATARQFNKKSPFEAYKMLCKAAADRAGDRRLYYDLIRNMDLTRV